MQLYFLSLLHVNDCHTISPLLPPVKLHAPRKCNMVPTTEILYWLDLVMSYIYRSGVSLSLGPMAWQSHDPRVFQLTSTTMETPATATVTASESRAKRQERSQARFRDRGGYVSVCLTNSTIDTMSIITGFLYPHSGMIYWIFY